MKNKTDEPSAKDKSTVLSCLIGLVIISPLPHGGETDWEFYLLSFIIFILLASCFYQATKTKIDLWHEIKDIRIPLIILLIWLLYNLLYIVPLSYNTINNLSPNTLGLKGLIIDTATNVTNYDYLSISRFNSLIEINKSLSYLGLFVLSCFLLNTNKRIKLVVLSMFLTSSLIGLYSIINFYTDGSISINETLTPLGVEDWSIRIRGLFSYHAHYATFIIITIPFGVAIIHDNFTKIFGKTKTSTKNILIFIVSENIVLVSGCVILFVVLLKTSSRGGVISLLLSLLITLAFLLLINKKTSHKALKALGYSIPLLILIMITFFSGFADSILKRFTDDGLNPHGREHNVISIQKIITDYPIFGTGSGTYSNIQNIYKLSESNSIARTKQVHARNDYLQLLSEQGIIGFLLLGTAITLLFTRVMKGLKSVNNKLYSTQVACHISLVAMFIHALFDSSFQLPVNSFYFFIILAIGVKATYLSKVDGLR